MEHQRQDHEKGLIIIATRPLVSTPFSYKYPGQFTHGIQILKEGSASPFLNHINPTLKPLDPKATHLDVSGTAPVITNLSDHPRQRTTNKKV